MKSKQDLQNTLRRIDGRGYKAYKDIEGSYDFGTFELLIDHVQGDPFAAPSRVRVRLEHDYPEDTYHNKSREVALRDFLARQFARVIRELAKGHRGSGKSGAIRIDTPGQEILERTAVVLKGRFVEVRFEVGLPAFGRRIAGWAAEEMLTLEVPRIVDGSLRYNALNEPALKTHLETCEDADALREKLRELNLIAFVADGAVLPRASGIDPRPLIDGVPFTSPESLRKEIQLPNRTVTGMGISQGVTLIVGGGYHGKSTLMNAIELGVYNHIPGDGRELVVTDFQAIKIRAEDGRNIVSVDISPFISTLPQGKTTTNFSTENASGSTSQAANIIESLEAGATAILIDEDTSATNFMIRDERMQELVPKSIEPITPYIDKARQLFEEHGVSTILVVGGSGSYFDIADIVVCMIEYEPHDVTAQARTIAQKYANHRTREGGSDFGSHTHRIPQARSIDPRKGDRVKISADGLRAIRFGTSDIDLFALEQLVDTSQTRAIGYALFYATRYMDSLPLREVLDRVMEDIQTRSLDILSRSPVGDYAQFRRLELAAALNRLRTLAVHQQ